MALVTTKEMFAKALVSDYAIGAFNVNNMEIVQGIVDAAKIEKAPLILQVSAGARKYARPAYLLKLVEAAIEDTGLDICLHLDHGEDFDICKKCVDDGFTSVMVDGSKHPFDSFISDGKTPAGRWGDPEDLAGPAVFLSSSASDFVNGQILYVDGGIQAYFGKQPS